MKIMVVFTFIIFVTFICVSAQCETSYQQTLDEHCIGVYISHSEVNNENNIIQIGLDANCTYALYLLNSSKALPQAKLSVKKEAIFILDNKIDEHQSISLYRFKLAKADTIKVEIQFVEPNSYALLALYCDYSNSLIPGFYNTFSELINNTPSNKFDYPIKTQIEKTEGVENRIYSIDINRLARRSIGKVYGFSDGKSIYLSSEQQKVKSHSEFFKAEDIGRYYYFKSKQLVPMSVGNVVTILKFAVEYIIDKNTGEITVLNKSELKNLIENDTELLERFLSEKKKTNMLKKYLVEFLDRNYL